MASRRTLARMRQKLAERRGFDIGISSDDDDEDKPVEGAIGGLDELEELAKTVKLLKHKMEQLGTEEIDPEIRERLAVMNKELGPYCEDYDPENSEGEREKTSSHKTYRRRSSSSSSSSESPPPEIPLRTIEKNLMRGHMRCAEKVYDYMMKCLGLRNPSVQQNEEYYDKCIGEAVMSLCMLYGDYWRESFQHVRRWIFKVDYFILYCCTILVERDAVYYFNYLIRMAIIFEMAWYCFDNDYDYFDAAKKCTYRFVDFIFFRDEGSWPALKNAASVIAVASRPLRFLVTCPKNNVGSFAGVVRQLEEYTTQGMVSMTRREIFLLNELKKKFESTARRINFADNPDETGEAQEELWNELAAYFRDCLPPGEYVTVNVSFFDSAQFSLRLDYMKDDTEFFQLALKQYRELPKTSETVSDVLRRRNIEEVIAHIDVAIEGLRRERRRIKKVESTSAWNTPTVQAALRTCGAKPKRQIKSGKDLKYFRLDKSYVEDVIDLYAQVLPSFLMTYAVVFSSKMYAIPDTELEEHETVFLIQESYYKRRKGLLLTPDECKRMLGGVVINDDYYKGKIKTEPIRVVPIHLQMLLDAHISEKTKCQRLKGFKEPMLAIPRVKEFGACPVWHIKEHFEKPCNTVIEAIVAIDEFERMLKGGFFRTSKEETDATAVLKFRFRSTANRITLPGQMPVPATKKTKGKSAAASQVPQTSVATGAVPKTGAATAAVQTSAATGAVPKTGAATAAVQTSADTGAVPKTGAATAALQTFAATGSVLKTESATAALQTFAATAAVLKTEAATAALQTFAATGAVPKIGAATAASQYSKTTATDPQISAATASHETETVCMLCRSAADVQTTAAATAVVPPVVPESIPGPSGQKKKKRKKRSKK